MADRGDAIRRMKRKVRDDIAREMIAQLEKYEN